MNWKNGSVHAGGSTPALNSRATPRRTRDCALKPRKEILLPCDASSKYARRNVSYVSLSGSKPTPNCAFASAAMHFCTDSLLKRESVSLIIALTPLYDSEYLEIP